MIDHLERGQVRTYAYPGGAIPIQCERQSILTISGIAQFTRWTILDIPGGRDTLVPPPIQAILSDITTLRDVAIEEPKDAVAQRDAINADLELHLHECWRDLHRHVLFGAHLAPVAPREVGIDPCGFGGADVIRARSKPSPRVLPDAWLAMVVVPPQIRSCTLMRPLLRCD
jgi:hypothetical protein